MQMLIPAFTPWKNILRVVLLYGAGDVYKRQAPRPINAEDPPQAIARGGSSMHDAA